MKKEEIERLVKERNNLIGYKEYKEICESEQIDHVKYNSEDKGIEIWGRDGTYVKVYVRSVKGLQ